MKRRAIFLIIASIFLLAVTSLWAEQRIEPFPSRPYDRFVIYETLGCFWAGIVGLIIIIRMKLREIARTRKMGVDREDGDVPSLTSDNGRVAP